MAMLINGEHVPDALIEHELALLQKTQQKATNRVSGSGAVYDAAGNLTSNGTNTYGFDELSRLISVGALTYGYNGDNKRVVVYNSSSPSFPTAAEKSAPRSPRAGPCVRTAEASAAPYVQNQGFEQ